MISFAFVQSNGTPVIGHCQTHCMRQLMACKSLSAAQDATGGKVGKLAAKGISSIPNPSLATRDMIFVIDHVYVRDGLSEVHEECDFMLNGQFYRMTTGYLLRDNRKDWHSWDQYPPISVAKIAMARSMASPKPLVAKPQPAPINHVATPGGMGQPAPTGFYAVVAATTPTGTYASMQAVLPKHYVSMAEIGAQPATFYMTP